MKKIPALIALSMTLSMNYLAAIKPEALRRDNHLSSLRNSTRRNNLAKTLALFEAKTPAEVAQLVTEGANPNATLDGTTLFLNAWRGQEGLSGEQRLALFQAYLDNGTDVNLPSAEKTQGAGFTFLHAAIVAQDVAAVAMAIANGADVDAPMMAKQTCRSTRSTIGYNGAVAISSATATIKSTSTLKLTNASPLIASIFKVSSAASLNIVTALLNADADATTVATATMTYENKAENTRITKEFCGTAAEFTRLMLEDEHFGITSPDGTHSQSLYLEPTDASFAAQRAILSELLPILEAAEGMQRTAV